jgi:hypothetical protein
MSAMVHALPASGKPQSEPFIEYSAASAFARKHLPPFLCCISPNAATGSITNKSRSIRIGANGIALPREEFIALLFSADCDFNLADEGRSFRVRVLGNQFFSYDPASAKRASLCVVPR